MKELLNYIDSNFLLYFLIIIAAIFIAIIFISSFIKKRKCPKCKGYIRTRIITKASLGDNYGNDYYQQFRIIYKCHKCGKTWFDTDSETYGTA
jgi:uncharacterized protein with PIN domain